MASYGGQAADGLRAKKLKKVSIGYRFLYCQCKQCQKVINVPSVSDPYWSGYRYGSGFNILGSVLDPDP